MGATFSGYNRGKKRPRNEKEEATVVVPPPTPSILDKKVLRSSSRKKESQEKNNKQTQTSLVLSKSITTVLSASPSFFLESSEEELENPTKRRRREPEEKEEEKVNLKPVPNANGGPYPYYPNPIEKKDEGKTLQTMSDIKEEKSKAGKQNITFRSELKPFRSPVELYDAVKDLWSSYHPYKANEISYKFFYPVYDGIMDIDLSRPCPPEKFQKGQFIATGASKSVNVLNIIEKLNANLGSVIPESDLVITSEKFRLIQNNLGVCELKPEGLLKQDKKKLVCQDPSFSETICASMVQMLANQVVPNYVIYYGFLHCTDLFYTIQEKMDNSLFNFINNLIFEQKLTARKFEILIMNVILQVAYAIYLMQENFKMVHNDLHMSNILVKALESFLWKGNKLSEYKYFGYKLQGNQILYFQNAGLLAKIADFGLAACYKPHVTNQNFGPYSSYEEYGIKNKFDGMYDILTLTCQMHQFLSDNLSDYTRLAWEAVDRLLNSVSLSLYNVSDFNTLKQNYFMEDSQCRPICLPERGFTVENFIDVLLKYTKDIDRPWMEFPSDGSKQNVYVF